MSTFANSPAVPRSDASLANFSRPAVTTLAIVLVAVTGWFDYVTGDFSLALFYLVPVGIATWYSDAANGWFMGFLSAVAWLVGELALSRPDGQLFLPYWNAAMLALICGVVVQVLSALHRLQVELEERVRRRTASLVQANAELDAARMHFIEVDKLEIDRPPRDRRRSRGEEPAHGHHHGGGLSR